MSQICWDLITRKAVLLVSPFGNCDRRKSASNQPIDQRSKGGDGLSLFKPRLSAEASSPVEKRVSSIGEAAVDSREAMDTPTQKNYRVHLLTAALVASARSGAAVPFQTRTPDPELSLSLRTASDMTHSVCTEAASFASRVDQLAEYSREIRGQPGGRFPPIKIGTPDEYQPPTRPQQR